MSGADIRFTYLVTVKRVVIVNDDNLIAFTRDRLCVSVSTLSQVLTEKFTYLALALLDRDNVNDENLIAFARERLCISV